MPWTLTGRTVVADDHLVCTVAIQVADPDVVDTPAALVTPQRLAAGVVRSQIFAPEVEGHKGRARATEQVRDAHGRLSRRYVDPFPVCPP